jgi:hypothetical protein
MDLTNPAEVQKLPKEMRAAVSMLGAKKVSSVRIGATDHIAVTMGKPQTVSVRHPDVRKVILDSVVQFSLDRHPDGTVSVGNVKGVTLDVGRFVPPIVPTSMTVRPDGTFDSEALIFGFPLRKGGRVPFQALTMMKDALDTFQRLCP